MPKTIKDVKKEVRAGSDIMENLLGGGFDAQTVRDNNTLINKIRQTISRNSDFSKEQTGLSLITLLNRDLLETKAVKGKDGSTETKQLINLDALLNNSENTIALSGILASESSRLELYRDYQRIYDLIPQLASAVDRYVESIISPDDPVKNSLTTVYTKPQTGEREDSIVKLGMEHIVKKYNLNKLTPKIIKEALVKGDCFYAVIAARDRVNAILSEENKDGEHREQDVVSESSAETTLQVLVEDDYFRPDVEKYLDHKFALYEERLESLKGDKALYEEKLQKLNESKRTSQKFYTDASHVVTKCINENIIIGDSSSLLAEESEVIQSLQMTEPPTLGSQKTPSIHVASRRFGYKGERDLNRDTKYTSIFSEPRDRNDKTISDDFLIKGSILKRLDPERVVKLERDGMEFGYLYFENFEEANFMSTLTYESDIKVFDKIFGKINSRDDIDKRNLIYNMFIRGISKRINKASFEKFPEFSEAICKLLDQDNIIQKQIRITYFRPEE